MRKKVFKARIGEKSKIFLSKSSICRIPLPIATLSICTSLKSTRKRPDARKIRIIIDRCKNKQREIIVIQ